MKTGPLILLALGLLALAGCSSTPAKVDTGPVKARTFSFVQPATPPAPGTPANRAAVHTAIQEALARGLANRGVTRTQETGDLVAGYLLIVGDQAATQAISDYYGYGRSSSELLDKAQKAYSSSKSPNYFQAGTLIVDLIDARTSQLVWRGHVTRPILNNPSAEARQERIQEAVDELFRDLRVVAP